MDAKRIRREGVMDCVCMFCMCLGGGGDGIRKEKCGGDRREEKDRCISI